MQRAALAELDGNTANAPRRTRAGSVLDPVVQPPKRRRRAQDTPVDARTEEQPHRLAPNTPIEAEAEEQRLLRPRIRPAETEEQRLARIQEQAEIRALERVVNAIEAPKGFISQLTRFAPHYLGSFDAVCEFCQALH